ncbi:MAG TPA: protein kinase [Polyangiaceae bacterium]
MPEDLPEAPPTTGPIAGKYDVLRLIGRGGMGTVWEGRHNTLGTRVAIKFIDAEYADSVEARTRFDNEARAAANIQSKHAIQIFDHGVTADGKPYIVMELLSGEPLDQRLDRLGRIPLAETARILRQVSRALARAHERGIVHRDLKPENIFLVRTPDDDDEIAKVLDFGIAKFKKMDGTTSGMPTSSTKTGAVLGTPFYMAPEQARGLRELDHRCDLWSMGVIAFKCVCGVLPFEGVSVGDLLVKICTAPAPVPSTLVPGLGGAFDAWFLRALEKDPARRFQNAGELAEGLAFAAGLSLKRPAGSLVPSSDGIHVSAAVSHPAVSSSSGAPVLVHREPGSGTSSPFTAPSPGLPTKSKGTTVAVGIAFALLGAGIAAFLVARGPKPGAGSIERGSAATGQAVAPTSVNLTPQALAPFDAGALDSMDIAPAKERREHEGRHGGPGHPTKPLPAGGIPGHPVASSVLPPPGPQAPTTIAVAPPPPPAPIATMPKPPSAPPPTASAKPANAMDPGY